uniref:Glutathione peroxidase n=1 Tax=Chromera velia CCMP2878 TaxID=1169474 RepID=A0A0G4I992_9ALVE|eukprot:Cvel_12176.t1-p1 / transcript=Cvel_12176.t1 / gene=Cvel_12176 / organism=Chromera_velia_CCMP2878 / gene_product=Putative glutathione peroxidase 7, chloroplastic, putative / transcript_product=Putative glutathione peroxidase 7, chloroplastic, putative / location=Cvel_scaffold786:33972-36665(+) / protein_length=289 / sequence_SO=supercontig / SO=protein_coding / is_pseudo=false
MKNGHRVFFLLFAVSDGFRLSIEGLRRPLQHFGPSSLFASRHQPVEPLIEGADGGWEEEAALLRLSPSPAVSRRSRLSSALSVASLPILASSPFSLLPSIAEASDSSPPSGVVKSVADVPITFEDKPKKMGDFLGPKATLLVNVASACALTPGNYEDLVQMYKKYHDKGLNIVGVPSNEFAGQEPEDCPDIRKNMKARFGVEFPLIDKELVQVGPRQGALYRTLMENPGMAGRIEWNFAKFLLDKNGVPIRRYKPGVSPMESALERDVAIVLAGRKLPSKEPPRVREFY